VVDPDPRCQFDSVAAHWQKDGVALRVAVNGGARIRISSLHNPYDRYNRSSASRREPIS
jgi:hypothetical protein